MGLYGKRPRTPRDFENIDPAGRPVKMGSANRQHRPQQEQSRQDNQPNQFQQTRRPERPAKPERVLKDLDQFREEVKYVIQSFDAADSYFESTQSFRAMVSKFNEAVNQSLEHYNVFLGCFKARDKNKLFKREEELRQQYLDDIITGDAEFDKFRTDVMNHDWYYDFSDSSSVRNAGERRHVMLEEYAKQKGGIFLAFWNHRVRKYVESIRESDGRDDILDEDLDPE